MLRDDLARPLRAQNTSDTAWNARMRHMYHWPDEQDSKFVLLLLM